MMRKFGIGKFVVLAFALLCAGAFLRSAPVSADTVTDPAASAQQIVPLEVEPICSDAAAGLTHWKVTNKNAADVNIHWTNLYNSQTGDYAAVNGVSTMLTSYDVADANNTTQFMSGTDTNQTNATSTPCPGVVTPPAPADCIDGHVQQNLNVAFVAKNAVRITTKDNKPLCEDQDINFSSYIMPSNYDGNGFYNNSTAYPQTGFSNIHATLEKNSFIDGVLYITLPDSCNNIQVDVYYGDPVDQIGPDGNGTENIASQVYRSTGSCDTPAGPGDTTPVPPIDTGNPTPDQPVVAPVGGMGGGATQETVSATDTTTSDSVVKLISTPKVVKPLQQPTTLPNTGSNLLFFAMIVPVLVSVGSYYFAEAFQKRRLV